MCLAPDNGKGGSDGTEDDDLDDLDEDELKALLEEDTDDDDPEDKDDVNGGDGGKKNEKPDDKTPPSKTFTQEEVDRIIAERLARDRRVQEEKVNQEREAEKQKADMDKWFAERYEAEIKKWTDIGYEEKDAAKLAQEDVAKEFRIMKAEQELEQMKQQQAQSGKKSGYMAERAKAISEDPLIKKYIDEIDDFAQHGTVLDFDTAVNFVIGKHRHELLSSVKTTTEQKTLANVNKRSNIGLEKGGAAATTGANSWTKGEPLMANGLGI